MKLAENKRNDLLIFTLFLGFGALLAYIDNQLGFHTILVETVHAIVVTMILVFAIKCEIRYPEMKQYGWTYIVWGLVCLMIGSWIDILDDPPTIALLKIAGVPFGRTWEQAFIKKILGYSLGIGLVAYGFFQWIPWMIETRLNVQKLNQTLSATNQDMNRLLMSLDERVESERLNISRELHDEVAQQLTFLNLQVQLCQKHIKESKEKALETLKAIGQELSSALRSVRQISHDLRPEPLYALGFIPALDQFMDKLCQQHPGIQIKLEAPEDSETTEGFRIENRLNDRELLHLFRILQEGVRNAIKHAKSGIITIHLSEEKSQFLFQIDDDGKGLPWQDMPSDDILVQQGHLGIVGMKERIKELNGDFRLCTRHPKGTRLEIVIPK